MATGFKYADPIASVFVGAMIIGTAWPLLVRSGRSLLDAAPDAIDIKGVKEDIERVSGEGTVHDLHVWSVGEYPNLLRPLSRPSGMSIHGRSPIDPPCPDSKNAIASMHLYHPTDSLKDYDTLAEEIRKVSRSLAKVSHHAPLGTDTAVPSPLGHSQRDHPARDRASHGRLCSRSHRHGLNRA